MRSAFLSSGKSFETPAIHQKNIQPAVVVEIVESYAATGGLEEIFVLVLPTENRFGVEAGFARDVEKCHAEIVRRSCGRLRFRG
jgi:hypothetical protein